MIPKARQQGLLVQEVGDELAVYDQERHRAHRLNQTATVVWRHCDGMRSVNDLAAVLQKELNPVADHELVLLTLDQLNTAHLLETALARSVEETRLSRRAVVRKVGLVGVLSLLLPAVTTIVVPTPAQAQSSPQNCGSS
jgi:hypothetical protein